ncbi:MAG: ABC transporter permease [Dermatophilaceae bacterium]|nr:ABC transporter permease [Dermatophilaceae bacterium]
MASAQVVQGPPDVDTQPAMTREGVLWRRRAAVLVRPVMLGVVLLVLYLWVQAQTLDSIETRTLSPARIRLDLWQHVRLSLVATALTITIAVPLGVLLTRSFARWIKPIGLGLGNFGQAIPSIGLIVLLALWLGIGFWSAVIGLVAYATLPILRNTIVGLDGVDPALKEAARGMGMSHLAVLRRVELPLAVPVILAGVRTALVLTVATATLATFIDAGGLGGGLITGIKLNRPTLTLTFGILAAVLALFADWVGGIAEEVLRPRGI